MKFSILICSLEKRKPYLDRLMAKLCPHVNKYNDVQVLINTDSGQMTIGEKRNKLIDTADGDYIAFIDDDDLVADEYVELVMGAINQQADVVGMIGIMTTDGRNPKTFIHSMQYDHWYESGGIYYRMPNHLNPVRKEYALATKFPLINSGEDHDYSNRMFNLLKGKKEIYIPEPIYFYDYRTRK